MTMAMMRRRLPFLTVVVQLISDSKESVTIHVHGTSDDGVQLEMLMFGSIHLVFHSGDDMLLGVRPCDPAPLPSR